MTHTLCMREIRKQNRRVMCVIKRFFKINNQWCFVYIPEKPNGFGVMLIGDMNSYVKENSSSWLIQPERQRFVWRLLKKGYTIFTSNFLGNHWGSQEAVDMAHSLYSLIRKQEILNERIHIVAEGMGALAALKLLTSMNSNLRSVAFINPCLELKHYYEVEKKNKFFYKRLLHELSYAYHVDENEVEKEILQEDESWLNGVNIPIHIFHETGKKKYPIQEHSRKFENFRQKQGYPIGLTIYLPGKRLEHFIEPITLFFRENEKKL